MILNEYKYPTALLVKTLTADALDGRLWTYQESPAYHIDQAAALAYDDTLSPLEKKETSDQVLFDLMARSFVE
ncbi:hypothetical protein ACVR0S_04350 [Streptococcus dentapri]|uniref:Uncharacterized protein n=1 Tax=Streptococcus dentapri TaxID=573564 RepID=A0ABV8D0J5_9STRE